MLDVRAVIKPGQHTQQAEAADGSPAHEFDEPVGGIGLRSDEHRTAREFAVAEGEKQAAAFVPVFVFIAAQTKCSPAQLNDADKHAEQVAEIAERLEIAIGERAHVRSEAEAEKIKRIHFACGVRETNQIDGPLAALDQGFERGVGAVLRKIAQKRIAGSERQKAERDALFASRASSTACPGPVDASTSIFNPFSRSPARAGPANLAERPPPAAGLTMAKNCCLKVFPFSQTNGSFSIMHGLYYNGRKAVARSNLASCSAREFLLILSEAVRGKSSLNKTTP